MALIISFIVFFIVGTLIYAILSISSQKEKRERFNIEHKKKEEEKRQKAEESRNKRIQSNGNEAPIIGISSDKWGDNCFYEVYKDAKRIFIKNGDIEKMIDFKSILNVTLYEGESVIRTSMHSKTTTDTGNMITRGIVGGVLLGGVGEVIGASTAKKNTVGSQKSNVTKKYKLVISINDFQEPTLILEQTYVCNFEYLSKLCSVLNIAIESTNNEA